METIHFKKLQLKNNVRIANRLKQRVALLADDYDLSLDQINSETEKRLLHFKDKGVADIEYMLNQYGIGLKKDIRLHRCVFQKTNAFSLEKRALRQSEKRTLQKTDINHQAEVREIFISKQQALEEKERLVLAQLEQKLTLKNLDEEIRLQASKEVENCYVDLYEAMEVERNRLREMADKKREQLKKQFLKQKEKLQKRLSLIQTKLKTYAEMEGIR
ncbi:MAG: hypothetical protein IH571_00970, partial [Acholeplasmataceae bacterium]|nr:hypothetical protein [Acholeplasmataceae bacterium]